MKLLMLYFCQQIPCGQGPPKEHYSVGIFPVLLDP